MMGLMAIALALSFRKNSVTHIFILMDHFLYRFSTISEKMQKINRLEVWDLSFATVSNAPWRVKFYETLVSFRIIYSTGPLLQNMTKIVCLRWLTFDVF